MSTLETFLIVLSLTGTGMMAGLFGAFSIFMMKSLAALGPKPGMEAMQMINRVILRASFFTVFFGTGLILLGLILIDPNEGWKVAGALSYLVFCIGATMFGNVPLNNRLEAADSGSGKGTAVWEEYLVKWTRWNHLRTIACLVAVVCLSLALRLG